MPETILTAHHSNDEPWRLVRVAKAQGIIEFMIGANPAEPSPLLGLRDHKGTLFANWRNTDCLNRYGHYAQAAWDYLDGGGVLHFVNESRYPGEGHIDLLTLLVQKGQRHG